MKKYKILHIFNDPKFSKGFFEFLVKHNINLDNDFLFHYRCKKSSCNNFGMKSIFSAHFFSPIANLLMLKPLFQSEKIIIHGLASPFLLFYLYLFPSLAHKSYWVVWGKDLYFYRTLKKKRFYHVIYEFFRKKVIKDISHIITLSEGDYELAKKWYKSNATWHKSFMYPSNLYKPHTSFKRQSSSITILVGNSADPTNNHSEIFSLLKKFKNDDIEIISPLSYGDKDYAKQVIELGKNIFGEKFKPIERLLPFDSYINLIKRVDIAIFAHKRQQAVGNIVTLLGMGKNVFIRNDTTTWQLLEGIGVKVSNLNNLELNHLDKNTQKNNNLIISKEFSEENLLQQWQLIFGET